MKRIFSFLWMLLWTACVGFAAWGCMYVSGAPEEGTPLRVTALDVGQGLAVLLEWNGRYALYDFGPDSVGVVDSLLSRGVDTLEWVLLSHNHRDHLGGFLEMPGGAGFGGRASSRGLIVRHLYVGPDTSGGFFRDSVLRMARNLGVDVDTVMRGDVLWLGEAGPRFEVLWPTRYGRFGENGASAVLYGKWGQGTVLLAGDLDSLGESRLLELNPTLSASLLQVAHHGSSGSNTLRFLSQVAPDYAFVSVGEGNGYGHPAKSVVRKVNAVLGDSTRFFRTDRDGSVVFELYENLGAVMP